MSIESGYCLTGIKCSLPIVLQNEPEIPFLIVFHFPVLISTI